MTAQTLQLRGMTWDHPRGVDPLLACSRIWRERTGVEIVWERRSLQDFESYPVAELAARYDLIVVDHPHVGQVTAEGCLTPLDVPGREAERAAMAAGSVGPSYPSYNWNGRQWAFPIDAAAQVQVRRPDRVEALGAWTDVTDAARQGLVLCPLRPPHSLMALFTLCGLAGRSPEAEGPELFDPETAAAAYETLRELAALVDPACYELDPIAVLERLAAGETDAVCAPLIYGYVSYARDGFRPARLAFSDLPVVAGVGPAGSAIGGTGIAVSAMSRAREAAIDFAYWVAGAQAQAGSYAAGGGQPGHAAAWESADVNAATDGFYAATRATLEASWLRPRHDGYMPFQHHASVRLNEQLQHGVPARQAIAELNALFRRSLPA